MRKDNNAPTERATSVDRHVGARMKLRRITLGISQQKLGETIGLTFQQVQKYERGNNRIASSRLYDLSKALRVPVQFFFDGMDETVETFGSEGREVMDLAHAFGKLTNPRVRRRVIDLLREMGHGGEPG